MENAFHGPLNWKRRYSIEDILKQAGNANTSRRTFRLCIPVSLPYFNGKRIGMFFILGKIDFIGEFPGWVQLGKMGVALELTMHPRKMDLIGGLNGLRINLAASKHKYFAGVGCF